MNQTTITNQEPTLEATTTGYAIDDAIQFYRVCIQQKRINQYSGNTKCVSLKTLVKKAILNTDEINDVRIIDLDTLGDRIESSLETLSTASIKTYVGRAHHAIREFIHWKETGIFKLKHRKKYATLNNSVQPDSAYFHCFFPIRQGKTVIRIDNIPRNLISKEVDMITNMVRTVLMSNIAGSGEKTAESSC